MHIIEIVVIAIGLAMDAFAVSLSAGTLNCVQNKRSIFRLSFHFGLFQFLMPIIGWFLGRSIVNYIASFDHWIVFIILSYIGYKMIREAFQNKDETEKNDPSKGKILILLALATSIDALAVGFSLALLQINIFYPSLIIGVITASLSVLAIKLGAKLGKKFGKNMEIIGGILLIIIGLKILLEHL